MTSFDKDLLHSGGINVNIALSEPSGRRVVKKEQEMIEKIRKLYERRKSQAKRTELCSNKINFRHFRFNE